MAVNDIFTKAFFRAADAASGLTLNPARKKLAIERIEKLQMRLLGLLEMTEHDTDPRSAAAREASQCIRDVAFIEAQIRGIR
jgi:hypothetical protein